MKFKQIIIYLFVFFLIYLLLDYLNFFEGFNNVQHRDDFIDYLNKKGNQYKENMNCNECVAPWGQCMDYDDDVCKLLEPIGYRSKDYVVTDTPSQTPTPSPSPTPSPAPSPAPSPSPTPSPAPSPAPSPTPSSPSPTSLTEQESTSDSSQSESRNDNISGNSEICEYPPYLDELKCNDSTYKSCPPIQNYYDKSDKSNPVKGDKITFDKIAQGWIDSGGNKKYCQHFLRTLAGECNPSEDSTGSKSCAYTEGGSGLMQLDSTRIFLKKNDKTADNGINNLQDWLYENNNNPCVAAHFARDLFVEQPDVTSATLENPVRYPNKKSGEFTIIGPNNACYVNKEPVNKKVRVREWQKDYDASPDAQTCNFIGPFCHRGINSLPYESPNPDIELGGEKGDDGIIWNGGGNNYQGPFTCYSNIKMLEYSNNWDQFKDKVKGKVSQKCNPNTGAVNCTRAECALIEKEAIRVATEFCNNTTGGTTCSRINLKNIIENEGDIKLKDTITPWKYGSMGYLENWEPMTHEYMKSYDIILYSFLTLVENPNPDIPPTIDVGKNNTSATIYESYSKNDLFDVFNKNDLNWARTPIIDAMKYCCDNNKLFIWAIGGWSDTKSTPKYEDQEYINNFVDNCIKILTQIGGDGIDFDWEHFSEDLPTRNERIKGMADIMIKLRKKIDESGELAGRNILISYTPRYNAFFKENPKTPSDSRAIQIKTEAEGIELFNEIERLLKEDQSSKYKDKKAKDIIDFGNIMMYDIDANYAFNSRTIQSAAFELQDYIDVLNAWHGGGKYFNKDQIIMGFEPGQQPKITGGIWGGMKLSKNVINYMLNEGFNGGIMFWAANDQSVEPNNKRKNWLNSRDISNYARKVGNKQERKDNNCTNWKAYMPTSTTSQSNEYNCPDNSYNFVDHWPLTGFEDCECNNGYTKAKNEDKCISTTGAPSTNSPNSDTSSSDTSSTDSPSTNSPSSDISSTGSPSSDTSITDSVDKKKICIEKCVNAIDNDVWKSNACLLKNGKCHWGHGETVCSNGGHTWCGQD